jgi:hypothetical protein
MLEVEAVVWRRDPGEMNAMTAEVLACLPGDRDWS